MRCNLICIFLIREIQSYLYLLNQTVRCKFFCIFFIHEIQSYLYFLRDQAIKSIKICSGNLRRWLIFCFPPPTVNQQATFLILPLFPTFVKCVLAIFAAKTGNLDAWNFFFSKFWKKKFYLKKKKIWKKKIWIFFFFKIFFSKNLKNNFSWMLMFSDFLYFR